MPARQPVAAMAGLIVSNSGEVLTTTAAVIFGSAIRVGLPNGGAANGRVTVFDPESSRAFRRCSRRWRSEPRRSMPHAQRRVRQRAGKADPPQYAAFFVLAGAELRPASLRALPRLDRCLSHRAS